MTIAGHSYQFSSAVLQARQRFLNRIHAAQFPAQTFIGGADDTLVSQGKNLIPEGHELHKLPITRAAKTIKPCTAACRRKFDPVAVEIDSDQLVFECNDAGHSCLN